MIQEDLEPAEGAAGQLSKPTGPPIAGAPIAGDSPEEQSAVLPYPVVGIGASAGGLQAYIELLKGLPEDTGMAFVLIPHLSPEHKSLMTDILARHTRMPVEEAQAGQRPEPNRIYIVPPSQYIFIQDGLLKLEPRSETDRVPRPIDRFFMSLAASQKTRAIGVVLSGTDSDGALGLKAIKGEGGISIVQDPESAQFEEMPRSGIAADHVDLIVPPAQIAQELGRLGREFHRPALKKLENGDLPSGNEQYFNRIVAMLRSVSGIDFRNYKQATLRRRLARRLVIEKMDSLAEYTELLHRRPDELRELQEDVLIGVTHFFRDPEVFDALKTEVFPHILDGRPAQQPVRFWVAGCSTGEEVYSIAICLLEYMAQAQMEPSVQIFGTDASDLSIQKARSGLYPAAVAGEVSPERLHRFFVKTGQEYQISKRIRDLCIFARQNLCKDPPFSGMDLISCRNVLIYLGAEVQRGIIGTFNYALRPGGYLLLGNSESLRNHSGLFAPVDHKNRVYKKVENAVRPVADLVPQFHLMDLAGTGAYKPAAAAGGNSWSEAELQRAADRVVLARFGPPGVVINEQFEVLQIRGHTGPYIEMPAGAPHLNLLRMVREGIASAVRDAVAQAIDQDVAVHVPGVQVRTPDSSYEIALEVLPLQETHERRRCFLVLFVPQEQAGAPAPVESHVIEAPEAEREIKQLRQNLTATRLYLQSLIEERDTRNEELTSAYEELQSANEEMQSTGEELETAKEELQSSNEELQTVNEELSDRNIALQRASNDLLNLFNCVDIPVLLLNTELKIRYFTPAAERLLNVRSADLGRSVSEIRLNLSMDNVEPLLDEVLDTLSAKEVEVQDRDGCARLMRVRPYRTAENKIEGLVVLLFDIDQIRRGEHELRQAHDFANRVLQAVPAPFAVLESDLRIRRANAAFRELTGIPADQLQHRSFPDLARVLWRMENLAEELGPLRADGEGTANFELEHETPPADGRVLRIFARAIPSEGSQLLLVTLWDITLRKKAERILEHEREQLAGQVQFTTQALGRTQQELHDLAAGLFTAQEDERRRVARELHDQVSQQLALLELQIRKLLENSPENSAEIRQRLSALADRTTELSEEVRRISHGLHPFLLEDLGLAVALRQLVEEFGEREGMLATFTERLLPEKIPQQVAASLYHIAQEALWNVSKHAGRTHVRVTLSCAEGLIQLSIRDLGEGFDVVEGRGRGLGMVTMEERARLVGGKVRIESTPGEGTCVEVEVPLPLPQLEG